MSVAMADGLDHADFHLQRLEYRFRRAQNALAGARAHYGTLHDSPEMQRQPSYI